MILDDLDGRKSCTVAKPGQTPASALYASRPHKSQLRSVTCPTPTPSSGSITTRPASSTSTPMTPTRRRCIPPTPRTIFTTNRALSIWWKVAAIVTMVFGFSVLIGVTVEAYRKAPPIPARAVDPAAPSSSRAMTWPRASRSSSSTASWTTARYGAMAPISARTSRPNTCTTGRSTSPIMPRRSGSAAPMSNSPPSSKAEIDGGVARTMKQNRYDPSTGTLSLSSADADSFKRQIAYWTDYFVTPANNGGLTAKAVADPQELRELTAFFAWTAWASTAARPGTVSFLHEQLSLRSARRQRADRRGRDLQRAQPGVPACRHGHRAARLRQVRPSRMA